MRFYAETFAISLVAGALYSVSWWGQNKLGLGHAEIDVYSLGFSFGVGLATGLVIGHQRWLRAVNEKIAELRSGESA